MVERITWEEFRESKMLWWVNMILHTFGLVLVCDVDMETGKISDVYPARTKYRGFNEKNNTEGYIGVSKYMLENSEILYNEAIE